MTTEPFLYGITVSLLQKLATFDPPYPQKKRIEQKLILLLSDIKSTRLLIDEGLESLMESLYKADDHFDGDYLMYYEKLLGRLEGTITASVPFIVGTSLSKYLPAMPGKFEWLVGASLCKYLPANLKWQDAGMAACFAYCALYPKGYTFRRESLVNQWMAEGFLLSSEEAEGLEDVGNRYFNSLVSQQVFSNISPEFGTDLSIQPVSIFSCQMHPLAHKAASLIAGNAVHILDNPNSRFERSIYVALLSQHGFKFLGANLRIRTCLYFGGQEHLFHRSPRFSWITRLGRLRVLDITGLQFEELPASELDHLRYLGMSQNRKLTKFGRMYHISGKHLQTLALDGCSQLSELSLNCLPTLRHLYLTTSTQINLENLPNTLQIIEFCHCPNLRFLSEEIKHLCNLKKLRIYDCPALVSLPGDMECLTRIEELVFHHCPRLLLTNGPSLNALPCLRRLELVGLHKLVELPVGLQSATALEYLMIANCERLSSLTNVLGHLTSLQRLFIYKCKSLFSLPQVIHRLKRLQSLHIRGCRNLIQNLDQTNSSNQWNLIAHIPDIVLQQEHHQEQVYDVLEPIGGGGGGGGTPWSMELGTYDRIIEVLIRTEDIVIGIGFVVEYARGIDRTTKYFGGQRGYIHKVTLKSNEYITHISGTHGKSKVFGVKSLRIHTNQCVEGHGPFGNEKDIIGDITRIPTTILQENHIIAGFHGRVDGQDGHLASIGAHVIRKEHINKDPSTYANNDVAARPQSSALGYETNSNMPHIFPYFTLKGHMLEKAGYPHGKCDEPLYLGSKWVNVARQLLPGIRRRIIDKKESERKERLKEMQEEERKLMCSLFTMRDYEFERDTVVQLWMAGGQLEKNKMDNKGLQNFEDVGVKNFEKLVQQDFLFPSTLDKKKYKVNPYKVQAILASKRGTNDYYVQFNEENQVHATCIKPWHVSLTFDPINKKTFDTLKKFKYLRTLVFVHIYSLTEVPCDLLSTLTLLQILDFSGSSIVQLPSSVENLTKLRYLDLSYTPIERLPESIDRLRELQTLKVQGCKRLLKLPKGMKKMVNLRHFYFDACHLAYIPRRLRALNYLHFHLSIFVVDARGGCNINELKSLNNLSGRFCLSGLENVPPSYKAKDQLLKHKKNLTHLQLRWNLIEEEFSSDNEQFFALLDTSLEPNSSLEELEISCYLGEEFPTWMGDDGFEKLSRISLLNCGNENLDIPLGELPKLKCLKIAQMNRVTKFDDRLLRGNEGDSVAFRNLETLIIDGMLSLEIWEGVESWDFPKLSELIIKDCPKLTAIPFLQVKCSLKQVEISNCHILQLSMLQTSSLESLAINHCPILKKRCTIGGEDWQLIKHVPKIYIDFEDAHTLIGDLRSEIGDNSYIDFEDACTLTDFVHSELGDSSFISFEDSSTLGENVRLEIGDNSYIDFQDALTLNEDVCSEIGDNSNIDFEDAHMLAEDAHSEFEDGSYIYFEDAHTLITEDAISKNGQRSYINFEDALMLIEDVRSELGDDFEDACTLTEDVHSEIEDNCSCNSFEEGDYMLTGDVHSEIGDSLYNDVPNCCMLNVDVRSKIGNGLEDVSTGNARSEIGHNPYMDDIEDPRTLQEDLHSRFDESSDIFEDAQTLKIEDACSVDGDNSNINLVMLSYCSIFPKNYEIEKEKLVQLWMATGFFDGVMCMEDRGNLFFDDFVNKSYIRVTTNDKLSGKKIYKFEEVKQCEDPLKHPNMLANSSADYLDISIASRKVHLEALGLQKEFGKLRTILLLNGSSITSVPPNIFPALKVLRTLDLSCSDIKELPSSIRHATELRYLDLSWTLIERLPDSITRLPELQTLKLKECVHLCHLPKGMSLLTKLRHLDFDILGQLTSMPKGMGKLNELRTLRAFIVGTEDKQINIEQLKPLKYLSGKLCLSGLEHVTEIEDAKKANLISKKDLLTLELRWSNIVKPKEGCNYAKVLECLKPHTQLQDLRIICFPGLEFPKWVSDHSYSNLVSIMLYQCENCKRLPSLGGLPKLLKLEIIDIIGVTQIEDRTPFPALQTLTIDGMHSLTKWSGLNGHNFPSIINLSIKRCLELTSLILPSPPPENSAHQLSDSGSSVSSPLPCLHLEIVSCRKLSSLPEGLLSTSLRTLIIEDCQPGVRYDAEKGGEGENEAKVWILSNNDKDAPQEDDELFSNFGNKNLRNEQDITPSTDVYLS